MTSEEDFQGILAPSTASKPDAFLLTDHFFMLLKKGDFRKQGERGSKEKGADWFQDLKAREQHIKPTLRPLKCHSQNLGKCTVEPVIGVIKETLGFRQFSLRGLKNVEGE